MSHRASHSNLNFKKLQGSEDPSSTYLHNGQMKTSYPKLNMRSFEDFELETNDSVIAIDKKQKKDLNNYMRSSYNPNNRYGMAPPQSYPGTSPMNRFDVNRRVSGMSSPGAGT
eukprot:CAMPEP_0168319702 /NCGR_PEP_ID=MMETSP0213-20121227/1217_1 /TAXON_ID=151035 /ORGANISM="Euplotes harpa, Strain FSP1.4" /LENGTH=112 /DNA_ID=CAMNT_0008320981 /DNA_START=704 /DNA_END=1039 /DNA_ORIENTATION=-